MGLTCLPLPQKAPASIAASNPIQQPPPKIIPEPLPLPDPSWSARVPPPPSPNAQGSPAHTAHLETIQSHPAPT